MTIVHALYEKWYTFLMQTVGLDDPLIRFGIVGIVLLLAIYGCEIVLVWSIKKNMKSFGKDVVRKTNQQYLSVAWLGWLCMGCGIALIELTLLGVNCFLITADRNVVLMSAALVIVIGIMLNLRNYCKRFVVVLKEKLY